MTCKVGGRPTYSHEGSERMWTHSFLFTRWNPQSANSNVGLAPRLSHQNMAGRIKSGAGAKDAVPVPIRNTVNSEINLHSLMRPRGAAVTCVCIVE